MREMRTDKRATCRARSLTHSFICYLKFFCRASLRILSIRCSVFPMTGVDIQRDEKGTGASVSNLLLRGTAGEPSVNMGAPCGGLTRPTLSANVYTV